MISIVSPVFNSASCLNELVNKIIISTETITSNFEIILVDDGSKDNSWEEIKELKRKYKFIKGIKLKKNYGQHEAIFIGIQKSIFKITIILDCDLQDDPIFIPEIYETHARTKKPVIIQHSYKDYNLKNRIISNIFWYFLSIISFKNFSPYLGNYLLIDEKVKQKYLKMTKTGYLYGDLVIQKNRFVKIKKKRPFGLRKQTTYNYKKLFSLAFKLILKYNIISRMFSFRDGDPKKKIIEKII